MTNAEQTPRTVAGPTARDQAINLFVVGFLVLFLELACIRWFAAKVVFLQYFTNVVLIASFLGMSCGCLAARRKEDWLGRFPILALIALASAMLSLAVYEYWKGLAIDVGTQASPQLVYFGTEYHHRDLAQFVVPIEAVAALFFVLVALMFVGLGQVLGRAFDTYPGRVMGYTLNIGGSLAGILVFSLISFLQAPPLVWFFIAVAGVAWLLVRQRGLTLPRIAGLTGVLAILLVLAIHPNQITELRWSPYYQVEFNKASRDLSVDTIGHQSIVEFNKGGSTYSLIHLLEKNSGGAPFHDVLIIGAGTGNDIDHALRFGARRVDAVEIDPVIQGIGFRENPDHPYQDARVVPHLDDGRHYLRTTGRKYDLVIFALVDSLVLHSSYANLRLESYLFTPEAFADVHRVLKPGGTFVMYNYFRQGWIVERIAGMAQNAFGCSPLVFSLPYSETIKTSASMGFTGFTVVIAGCNPRIRDAFAAHGIFWLNETPPVNLAANGFTLDPRSFPPNVARDFGRISPARLIHDSGPALLPSDDWPFLYLRSRLIPDFTVRSMLLIGFLGIGMVWLFLPKGSRALHSRMFFLGAAFMLLETRAVVQMALLFGSTWLVNSAVFATVLVLILLANLVVLRVRQVNLVWCYAGLFAFLALGAFVPVDQFLSGGVLWRYVTPCVIALGPMLFAGAIFAQTFKDAPNPDVAFGSNIAGSVVGGLAESFSMLLGFQHLLILAMAFYALSIWAPTLRMERVAQPA